MGITHITQDRPQALEIISNAWNLCKNIYNIKKKIILVSLDYCSCKTHVYNHFK